MIARGRGKIRPPRRGLASKDDNVDFETIWAILSSSLREIHTKNASKLSFEELYRNAYKLVLKKKGEELYGRVRTLEEDWLNHEVRERINALVAPSLVFSGAVAGGGTTTNEKRAAGERFLAGLREAWEDHQLCMSMITDVLMYMDRVYCTDHRRPSIFTTAMALFRDYVLRTNIEPESHVTVAYILNSVILSMIQMERDGDIIARPLVRACIYMLEGLYETETEEESTKLYLTVFEPEYLAASRDFYAAEGQSLLQNADASTFCKHATNRLREEEERCKSTLSMLTEPKIKSVIDEELIKKNIRDVIALEGSGVKHMLEHDRIDDLRNVYDLVSRVDKKQDALKKAVQKRVVELGSEINASANTTSQGPNAEPSKPESDKPESEGKAPAEKPVNQQTVAAIKWVDDILQLKMKFDNIWNRSFRGDQGMQTSLTNSFQDFVNANTRSQEYLSLFFDENLKKGIKGKTENEVDALLENGITLLSYIKDKDLFETYYKKHLSRRLLMKRSASMDAERQMISKMKMAVGNAFTQKLEAMFKDMAISEDLTSNYKEYVSKLGDRGPKRIDLDMSVLTSTMWPMESMGQSNRDETPRPTCVFPRELETIQKGFEKFYLNKHSGRQLSWQPNMGTADIRATFHNSNGKVKRHEINVSTYGVIILLLFNELPSTESLTAEEIEAQTNIPPNDLNRNLQSLALNPKTRILKKVPMSKEVSPTDKFFFNEDFHSVYMKVKILAVSSGGNKVENNEERRETEKKMNDERGGSIEAAVVRIMKQRKQLSHQQLLTEVITQLASRFRPDVNMVKKRIESLIDREYIERVAEAEIPSYSYVA